MRTPTTLREAIKNGLEQTAYRDTGTLLEHAEIVITVHVKDFLANKFGAPLLDISTDPLSRQEIGKLWKAIFGDV
jgi:hypothetical protein